MKIIFLLFLTSILFAENRIKIGIIDSGISKSQAQQKWVCKDGIQSFVTNDLGYDHHGHGQNIIGLVTRNINHTTHCIVSYKISNTGVSLMAPYLAALNKAINDKVSYINLSLNGSSFNGIEYKTIKIAVSRGIVLIVAAGNEGIDLDESCDAYPACYKSHIKDKDKLIVIGANIPQSNYSSSKTKVDCHENGKNQGSPMMSGTSQATANYSNKLINQKNKKCGIMFSRK